MDSPEMQISRLLLGKASKEDIQQLKETGWLTPSLEKLYSVEIIGNGRKYGDNNFRGWLYCIQDKELL